MVLVTGGTGLVGAHLLLQLVKTNTSVKAIYRDESSFEALKKCFSFYVSNPDDIFTKIEWFKADITNIPQLTEAFIDVKEVYHCAAMISFTPSDFDALKKTNIEGTANIVNLCLSYGVSKLCYVSSIATLGATLNDDMITEDTHWNNEAKNSVYAISKYGAELEVWRGTQEGLNAVIVNPGVIIGPGFWYKGSGSLIRKVDKGLNYFTTGITGFVGVNDVVDAMLKLMKSSIINERFVLVSENWSYKEFFNAIAKSLKKSAPKQKTSRLLLEIAWRIDWLKHTLFNSKRRFTKSMAKTALKKDSYSAHKIKNTLNYSFQTINEVIEQTCEIYISK